MLDVHGIYVLSFILCIVFSFTSFNFNYVFCLVHHDWFKLCLFSPPFLSSLITSVYLNPWFILVSQNFITENKHCTAA